LIPNTADPLAILRVEQNALQRELNTISSRMEGLQLANNTVGVTPQAAAELDALSRLNVMVVDRQEGIAAALANPPAELLPPKSGWERTIDATKATADAIQSAATTVATVVLGGLNWVRKIPVPFR
jgi:hypothetical protein